MDRRHFLAVIPGLSLLGWLKPAKVKGLNDDIFAMVSRGQAKPLNAWARKATAKTLRTTTAMGDSSGNVNSLAKIQLHKER